MSSVLHRFTSPTCTLEIKGERLSRSRRSELQFELRFDDLCGSTLEPIIIKGDRQDLEQLQEAVDSYWQKLPPASFQPDIERENLAQSELKNTQSQLRSRSGGGASSPELVNHELFLGFLDRDNNVDRVKLTTVQLFDLVTALKAYRDATLLKSKPEAAKIFLLLGAITATTVIAVGISQILSRTESTPDIAPISPEEPTPSITELDEVVPPPTTSAAEQPTPQPKLTEPLTSAVKLPPPPAVDTPKPKPNIPDPADYPLPEVARQSQVNIVQQPASKEQTELSREIAGETNEANSPEIPTDESTIIIDSAEPDTISSTIQVNPNTNLESEKSDRSAIEPSQEIAEDSPPTQIAKSSQPSQIQQITSYFEERWQPPAELKQSLEYRLWLNADGTIERVVPLGKASQLYIDRTNIPLKGESFINSQKSQSSIVRLLLSPDGEVQALSE